MTHTPEQATARLVEILQVRPELAPEFLNIALELFRAENKWPDWPTDAVYAAAVLVEEPGEALKEANNFRLSGGDEQYREAMGKEAVQSGAMAVRFLLNMKNYKV